MIEIIPALPPGTAGFRLSGTVTAEDYRDVLEPAVRTVAAVPGPLNAVVVISADFDRFTLGAGMQDALVGLRNEHEWGRIAIVSEHDRINTLIGMFGALAKLEFKVFRLDDEAGAVAWAAQGSGGASG